MSTDTPKPVGPWPTVVAQIEKKPSTYGRYRKRKGIKWSFLCGPDDYYRCHEEDRHVDELAPFGWPEPPITKGCGMGIPILTPPKGEVSEEDEKEYRRSLQSVEEKRRREKSAWLLSFEYEEDEDEDDA